MNYSNYKTKIKQRFTLGALIVSFGIVVGFSSQSKALSLNSVSFTNSFKIVSETTHYLNKAIRACMPFNNRISANNYTSDISFLSNDEDKIEVVKSKSNKSNSVTIAALFTAFITGLFLFIKSKLNILTANWLFNNYQESLHFIKGISADVKAYINPSTIFN